MVNTDADSRFRYLDGLRSGLLDRLKRLSELTVRTLLPDENYENTTDSLTNGFTSIGAVATNHLTNKIALTMFAPSRPFLRLDLPGKARKKLLEDSGMTDADLDELLAAGEREALHQLELSGSRPALYEIIMHLIGLGNVLMDTSGDVITYVGIQDYVVRRAPDGTVVEFLIRECTLASELTPAARQALLSSGIQCEENQVVPVYKWLTRDEKRFKMTCYVQNVKMADEYNGNWLIENCPYIPLVWRLPYKQHYGVGRAEEYANDLAGCERLAESLNDGAMLASTFRWLQNPAGSTDATLFVEAPNGGVVPGIDADLELKYANIGTQLSTVTSIAERYERRVGEGFLLNSAVTRDAERVTAEEIRLNAMELDTSLGGNYSRLAPDLQGPVARFALRKSKIDLRGTKIQPMIITGLDALSRSADSDRMRAFLGDVVQLSSIPETIRVQLNERNIITDMAAGHGVDKNKYINTPEVVQARMDDMQQRQAAADAAPAVAEATAEQITNPETPE